MPSPQHAAVRVRVPSPRGAQTTLRLHAGGGSLPLAEGSTGESLLERCDPFRSVALAYWQTCINHYVSAAYAKAMAGQALAQSNKACVSTMSVDPAPWLWSEAIKLPLLALFPVSVTSDMLTMGHERIARRYRFSYLLDPMPFAQYQRIEPLLCAVLDLLVMVTERQSDPEHGSNTHVWQSAGTTSVRIAEARFGFFEGKQTGHLMPALEGECHVVLRDTYDESGSYPLWGHNVSVSAGDDEGYQLEDFIEARVDIPA